MKISHSTLAILTALSLAATISQPAAAQGYPNKAIRIIVPTVPGAGPDVATRQVTSMLSVVLKQPIIVENKPGANGTLAANEVAKSAPDGYTVFNANIGNALNDLLRPETTSRLGKELIPVTDITASPMILFVHPSVPAKTLKELIDLARAKPGSLNYSSGGPGSLIELIGERLKLAANVNITEIPYKSFGADTVDLLAGHVQVGFGNWSNIGQYLRSGKLRPLAIASPHRSPLSPDIPTMGESGYPEIVATGWNGMFVPAGTPPEVIQTLQRGIAKALENPDVKQFFAKDGVEMGGRPPAEFSAFVDSEKERYAKVIKTAGIKLD